MKITLQEAVDLWNGLSEVASINDNIPSSIRASVAYLRPEIRKWNELSKAEQNAFKNAEIDVPLIKIKKDELVDLHIAPDVWPMIAPIVDGEITPHKTQLEKLIEAKNGEVEQEVEK